MGDRNAASVSFGGSDFPHLLVIACLTDGDMAHVKVALLSGFGSKAFSR